MRKIFGTGEEIGLQSEKDESAPLRTEEKTEQSMLKQDFSADAHPWRLWDYSDAELASGRFRGVARKGDRPNGDDGADGEDGAGEDPGEDPAQPTGEISLSIAGKGEPHAAQRQAVLKSREVYKPTQTNWDFVDREIAQRYFDDVRERANAAEAARAGRQAERVAGAPAQPAAAQRADEWERSVMEDAGAPAQAVAARSANEWERSVMDGAAASAPDSQRTQGQRFGRGYGQGAEESRRQAFGQDSGAGGLQAEGRTCGGQANAGRRHDDGMGLER